MGRDADPDRDPWQLHHWYNSTHAAYIGQSAASTTSKIEVQSPAYHFVTMAPATAPSDKSKPWIPLASKADDGWSRDGQATATCFCGAVQLVFVS